MCGARVQAFSGCAVSSLTEGAVSGLDTCPRVERTLGEKGHNLASSGLKFPLTEVIMGTFLHVDPV